jgi:transposase
MLQPVNRRTWAPRGQTPIQYAWDRHDRLSVIAALVYQPRSGRIQLPFAIHDQNIRVPQLMDFLRQLRRQTRRPIILVCDRWQVHRSAGKHLRDQGADWLTIEWLPSYAPDLNPVEAVWNYAKYTDLPNYIPDDKWELFDEVAQSLNDQHSRRPLLKSFFARAELNIS